MKMLQGHQIPVRVNFFLIVNPPDWFDKVWAMMRPMLSEDFRQKVRMLPESYLSEYLAHGYAVYLPNEMASGQADTEAIVNDFIACRQYIEDKITKELNGEHQIKKTATQRNVSNERPMSPMKKIISKVFTSPFKKRRDKKGSDMSKMMLAPDLFNRSSKDIIDEDFIACRKYNEDQIMKERNGGHLMKKTAIPQQNLPHEIPMSPMKKSISKVFTSPMKKRRDKKGSDMSKMMLAPDLFDRSSKDIIVEDFVACRKYNEDQIMKELNGDPLMTKIVPLQQNPSHEIPMSPMKKFITKAFESPMKRRRDKKASAMSKMMLAPDLSDRSLKKRIWGINPFVPRRENQFQAKFGK
jgi:CRAL/TRIO domain